MPLVTEVHNLYTGTSIVDAAYARVLSADAKHLIVARRNELEIFDVTADGLVLAQQLDLCTSVRFMKVFEVPEWLRKTTNGAHSGSDCLILFPASHKDPIWVLWFDGSEFRFIQKVSSPNQLRPQVPVPIDPQACSVDPSGSYVAFQWSVGTICLMRVGQKPNMKKNPSHRDIFGSAWIAVPVDFIHAISLTFVSGFSDLPTLAIAYETPDRENCVALFTVSGSKLSKLSEWTHSLIQQPGLVLVPIPEPANGLLAYCGKSVLHVRPEAPKSPAVVTSDLDDSCMACCVVDSRRLVLSSPSGQLSLLVLGTDADADSSIFPLGKLSTASNILHLSGSAFFQSHSVGTSSLFDIDLSSGHVTVIHELQNLAPLLEISLHSRYNSPYILCCSGETRGTLKRLESARAVESLVLVDGLEISQLWSFADGLLLASGASVGHVIKVDENGDVSQVTNYASAVLTEQTLNVGQVADSAIQVTPSRVVVVESGLEWKCPDGTRITHSSIHSGSVAVSLEPGHLVICLNSSLEETNKHELTADTTALSVHDQYCVVSTWDSPELTLLPLHSSGKTQFIPLDVKRVQLPVRSLQFVDVSSSVSLTDGNNTSAVLFCGMSEGSVIALAEAENRLFAPCDNFQVGVGPVEFYPFIDSLFITCGDSCVMASDLLLDSSCRLQTYLATVTGLSPGGLIPLSGTAFGGESLAFIKDNMLQIGLLSSESLRSTGEVEFGATAECHGHLASRQCTLVGTCPTTASADKESRLTLIDGSFKIRASLKLDGESADYIVPLEYEDFDGGQTFFVVSTSRNVKSFVEHASNGRLLLIGITEDLDVVILHSKPLNSEGACLEVLDEAWDGHRLIAGCGRTLYGVDVAKFTNGETELILADAAPNFPNDILGLSGAGKKISVMCADFQPWSAKYEFDGMLVFQTDHNAERGLVTAIDSRSELYWGHKMTYYGSQGGFSRQEHSMPSPVSTVRRIPRKSEWANWSNRLGIDDGSEPIAAVGTLEGGLYLVTRGEQRKA